MNAPAQAPASPSPSSGGVAEALREYFLLNRAFGVEKALGDARPELSRALTLSRQKADAAETLWSNGHTAEGLRMAREALEEALQAAQLYARGMRLDAVAVPAAPKATKPAAAPEKKVEAAAAPAAQAATETETESETAAEPATETETAARSMSGLAYAALVARGVTPANRAAVVAAADAAATPLPALDDDVDEAAGERHRVLTRAHGIIDGALRTAGMDRGELSGAKRRRIATSAGVLALLVAGWTYYATRPVPPITRSSANHGPAFPAELAFDGREDTAWLLPDNVQGWVEAELPDRPHISVVRLLNTSNPPWGDRGTLDYAVEIYVDGEVAQTLEEHWDFSASPTWTEHEIDVDNVERIRFLVRTSHRQGGGLAELQWR